MKNQLIYMLIIIFMASCHKDDINEVQTDSNGVVVAQPYLWRKSLHLNGMVSNSNFRQAIYYNGNIVIPTTNGGNNRLMTLINPANGDFIWSWDDRYQPETEDIFITYYFQYNNLLTYQKGDRSYCINMDNGTTKWKFRRNEIYGNRIYPKGDNTFFYKIENTNSNNNNIEWSVFSANINDGSSNLFVNANYSGDYVNPGNLVGAITNITRLPNNSNLYAITYMEPSPNWVVNTYLGLYNEDTHQWVYERKLMAPPTVNSSAYEPKIYNDKLYAWVGKNLVCHNLETGEQLWRKPFPQDFLFSGFIIADGKIIANNEDTYTYGINPENGAILWKTKTSGTSGRMSYLDGIVYFVGGSSAKLHAIDIDTGDHVWKLDALKMGEPDGNRFKTNAIYVFPATNGNPAKIVALSHKYAYCFEAYEK